MVGPYPERVRTQTSSPSCTAPLLFMPSLVATAFEAWLSGAMEAVKVETPCSCSRTSMTAVAASVAIPAPCHATPTTQASEAARSPTVACTKPIARASETKRITQLSHSSRPLGELLED